MTYDYFVVKTGGQEPTVRAEAHTPDVQGIKAHFGRVIQSANSQKHATGEMTSRTARVRPVTLNNPSPSV